jgi:hypothetical protein
VTKTTATEWWRLMRAAAKAKISYGAALHKVLTGEWRGEQRDGKWWVQAESVRRHQNPRAHEAVGQVEVA